MKKIFLVAIACCIAATVSAQIKLTLVLNATPPAQLSEWGTRREVLMLIVSPPPGFIADFKIKTEIKTSDGTIIGTTDLAAAPVFSVGSTGNLILTAVDVLPLDKMIFTGKYKTSLQRTGKLLSDTYTMCVTAVRPTDYTPLSIPECKSFYLASIQLPILMKPYDGEMLDANTAQTAITFRWTPMVPRQSVPVSYRVQVFEVLEHQNAVQAMRSNQPLLDQEVIGTTQYIWRPQMSFIEVVPIFVDGNGEQKNINMSEAGVGPGKNKQTTTVKPKPNMEPDTQKNINASVDNHGSGHNRTFIWTVQTLDDHGLPVTQTDGSGEGRSEPIVFIVKMKAKEKANR